jgi:hypothetical protein
MTIIAAHNIRQKNLIWNNPYPFGPIRVSILRNNRQLNNTAPANAGAVVRTAGL